MQAQSSKMLKTLDDQIHALQNQLAALGPMRPGTLTRQYRQPQKQKGPYYQLSYTYRMKSHTEYVPKAQAAMVRQEIAVYRRYKRLTARWIDLALRRSRLRMRVAALPAEPPESACPAGSIPSESGASKTRKRPKNRLSYRSAAQHSPARRHQDS
jgi:Family of unknown function (DUF6788)